MHTTFPLSQADTKLHDVPRGKSPSSNVKTGTTTKDAEKRTASRPANLPHELDEYLTTTNQPRQVFELLLDSRDRRLRLLLRRFTNQIQYGCKNPQCEVATCLSYRKRSATIPLRAYNDVAARALAWRCVEEYADADKARSHSEGTTIRRKNGRDMSFHSDISVLCWNEPVVPWYEDRSSLQCGSKTATRRQGKATHGSAGTSRVDSVVESALANAQIDGSGQYVIPQNTKIDCNTTRNHKVGKGAENISNFPIGNTSENIDRDYEQNEQGGSKSSTSLQSQRHVVFAEPLEEHPTDQKPTAKDKASFTQMVYDTSSIQELDQHRPRISADQDISTSSRYSNLTTYSQASRNKNLDQRPFNGETDVTTADTATLTFQILPLSVILWLRSTMPYDAQSSPLRDLNMTADYGDYSRFARQSLHFCLSNPFRLIRSASTWHYVHRQPHKLDEDKHNRMIRDLASKEEFELNSPSPKLPQPGGVMVAFGMLIAIISIPEILDHLFAALQHSYNLPPSLENVSSKEGVSLGDFYSAKRLPLSGLKESSVAAARMSSHTPSNSDLNQPEFLEDRVVAQLCMLVLLALQLILALKPHPLSLTHTMQLKNFGEQYSVSRRSGKVFPYANLFKAWSNDADTRPNYHAYTSRLDTMDGWHFQRILDGLADVISHRLALIGMKRSSRNALGAEPNGNVVDIFIDELFQALQQPDTIIHKHTLQKSLIDLMRSVILRRWDREAIIQRRGPVGGALELLAALFRKRQDLGIPISDFQWAFIGDAFDEIDMPLKWLDFREDNKQTHILAFSFLFEPANLVVYFRAINSIMMKRSHQSASSIFTDAFKLLRNPYFNVYGADEVLTEMRPNMARFFVLTIRRSNMLQDAFNQIWRRQRQELLRPLKVRLGRNEGEDGLDHGGVQAEFFRLVLAEALDPDYGMFTIDDRTRMTWFQPDSMEPLYKFEVLGILVSLAVYNGTTLPITFPLAFYRKLLGFKVKTLQHIQDGWPDLARGLQQLLDWNDGDVGDVMSRTYEFSYEAFGASYNVDMTKVGRNDLWPPPTHTRSKDKLKTTSFGSSLDSPPSPSTKDPTFNALRNSGSTPPQLPDSIGNLSTPLNLHDSSLLSSLSSPAKPIEDPTVEAPLVTNLNRDQYVKDYVHWLTHKSIAPQFTAFAAGFSSCLDQTALSIFTPEHLKTVIEGHQHIDIDGLQATTTYDDYKSTDDIVRWFWEVVRDMSTGQHRKLLEFVTASDRVPVNGIQSIVFIVQKNGEGDERLPSSSTCYGRLLMPKYSSKDVLKEKLEKAIENSVGFGSL